ncbi:unnamed protein product [Arctogadus glacialis]
MATMLVTAIAAPQPTYSTSSTSSTCQLIIVIASMSSIVVMWVLSICGLRRCCLRRVQKYVTALSRSRPRPRPGGTICGGKRPVLLPCRVVSSRVESSYMCGGKAALVSLLFCRKLINSLVSNRNLSVSLFHVRPRTLSGFGPLISTISSLFRCFHSFCNSEEFVFHLHSFIPAHYFFGSLIQFECIFLIICSCY